VRRTGILRLGARRSPERSRTPARLSARSEAGFTLIELLVVASILVILLTALTEVLVSALHTQTDQTTRAQGQQDARLALDKLRREIHCATSVVFNPSNVTPSQSATITLGDYCPSYSATSKYVTWCTSPSTPTSPYTLWRYPHTADPGAGATYLAACSDTGQ
jgi:prepilin-type N-terminal cleavage/methylation domain-containing protein